MKSARSIGRVGGLAGALGVGAWLASVPWLAAADPDTSGLDATALDPSALVGSAAADPSGLNLAVSYDGVTLFQSGDATATSFAGQGDLAIAYGDGSVADSGTYTADGITSTGNHDYAFADGAGSTATADGTSNSAVAEGGGTAFSGEPLSTSLITGTGAYEYAFADGAGSSATTGFGDDNIAEVFGNDSSAVAGLGQAITSGTILTNNNDLAVVFGNDLTASATGGSNLFDIEPGSFTNAAAAVPVDDFGLSSLLADFSWLGL
jgi:hypothetical protein